MIVLRISLTLKYALKTPAIAPQNAPPRAPAIRTSGIRTGRGKPGRTRAVAVAGQAAHRDLPFTADVEDVCAEGDADPDADEQQRNRLDRGAAEGVAPAERSGDERAVAR